MRTFHVQIWRVRMINRTKMVTIKASSMVLLDFFGVLALVVILFTGLHLPEFL